MENKDTVHAKEVWTEPKIFSLDFKETKGGTASDAAENVYGTIGTISG